MKFRNIKFLGDVHGKIGKIPNDPDIVQVGDLGCGFVEIPEFTNGFRFIRGNHDNPEICRKHPNYIGDWKLENGILFLSGAGSIDMAYRTEGVNWWREEELTTKQMSEVFDNVDTSSVRTVVAHDFPLFTYGQIHSHHIHDRFVTPRFLSEIQRRYRPAVWVGGHHHISKVFQSEGTKFYVLGELQLREIQVEVNT